MSVVPESSNPELSDATPPKRRARSRWLAALAMAPVLAGAAVLTAPAASAAPQNPNPTALTAAHGHPRAAAAPVSLPTTDGRTATFTLQKFEDQGGQLFATGTLTAPNGQTAPVSLPVLSAAQPGSAATPAASAPAAAAAAPLSCSILDLTLGPIHLDLLGLVVDLNQVHLTITAVPGAGNLLGNLLCGVAGLLDGGLGGTPLANLINLLNGLLGLG